MQYSVSAGVMEMDKFSEQVRKVVVEVQQMGGQLGQIIAFAVITETVFAWPGVGQLFVQSVYAGDIPVMAAYLSLIAVLFVVINLAVDLLYYEVDPRLRSAQAAARAT